MAEQPTDFFWEVSAAALAHSDVATGTMMGFPCLRVSGAFFASCDHRSGDLIVKLPRHRVEQQPGREGTSRGNWSSPWADKHCLAAMSRCDPPALMAQKALRGIRHPAMPGER